MFWVNLQNFIVIEDNYEHIHGWFNTVILNKGRKILSIISVHVIADNNEKSVNSSKAQNDWKVGQVTRAKEMRAKTLKEITE